MLLTVKVLNLVGLARKTGQQARAEMHGYGASNTVATAIYWFNLWHVNEYSWEWRWRNGSFSCPFLLDKYSLIFDNIRVHSKEAWPTWRSPHVSDEFWITSRITLR